MSSQILVVEYRENYIQWKEFSWTNWTTTMVVPLKVWPNQLDVQRLSNLFSQTTFV